MSVNKIEVSATPDDVWAVLADGRAYVDWVVGCKEIRAVDDDWPARGSSFYHRVGVGPMTVADRTTALVSEPRRRLVISAKARPVGTARVEIELQPSDHGTTITLREWPESRALALADNPFFQLAMDRRNARSLLRLKELAEARQGAMAGPERTTT